MSPPYDPPRPLRPPSPRTDSDYARAYADIAAGYYQRLPKIEDSIADISAAVIRIEKRLSEMTPMRDRAASVQDVEEAIDTKIDDAVERFEETLERHHTPLQFPLPAPVPRDVEKLIERDKRNSSFRRALKTEAAKAVVRWAVPILIGVIVAGSIVTFRECSPAHPAPVAAPAIK